MLDFFRKYQRFFFVIVSIVLIISFSFFGTFSTFIEEEKREEKVVGKKIDGSEMYLSEIQELSRFLQADRDDLFHPAQLPNLCNDGVIRRDFLQNRVADLLVANMGGLKEDLEARLQRAKQFRPYAHPEMPFLSVEALWERVSPQTYQEWLSFRQQEGVGVDTFSRLSNLYQKQSTLSPDHLRRFLLSQQRRAGRIDPRLPYEDLTLFGFHSLTDWFGLKFIDEVSTFILHAAALSEEKGFFVSLEEARGDLFYNFEISMRRLGKNRPQLTFRSHLQSLGFDEKRAAKIWQKVLLFRRLFQSQPQAALLDRLPYISFASYALETAVIDLYRWPAFLTPKTALDSLALHLYLQAISPEKELLPTSFYPIDEVQKRADPLVQKSYQAEIASVSQDELLLCAPVQEIWEWQLQEKNWKTLCKEFSFLTDIAIREERFKKLEKLSTEQRKKLDLFTRQLLLKDHPEWIDEALASAPRVKQLFTLSRQSCSLPYIKRAERFAQLLETQDPTLLRYSEEGKVYACFENVEQLSDWHILTFEEAFKQDALTDLTEALLTKEYFSFQTHFSKPFEESREEVARHYLQREGKKCASDSFFSLARKSLLDLSEDPCDPRWIRGKGDPLFEQFKLERKEREIQRMEAEDAMKEELFLMTPEEWSSIRVAEDGEVSFFYFREKRLPNRPILDQLHSGKELIAQDAQRYLAERLIERIKKEKKDEPI